jgi:type I restriction enzyme S subunit
MTNWSTDPLKNLTTKIGSGATPEGGKKSYKDEGISLIRSQNVYNLKFERDGLAFIDEDQAENLSHVQVEGKDVLLNITGHSVGRCCMVPDRILPARVNQHVMILRADPSRIDPRYLLYYVNSPDVKRGLLQRTHGATRDALTKGQMEAFEVKYPPLSVQRRIADILGALDDKIELNRRMNETLEEMAQALYRHWFVDFGPFQDREFVDTEELGPIPKRWEVAPLETIVNIELDNIDPQDHPEEEFDYYSFSAYDEEQYPEIEVGGEIGSRKSLVKRRKVMVSRLNPGDYRIWTVYPDGERRGITSTEFIHFVPVRESLWGYLNCHLRSEGFKADFRRHASGTTGSRQRVRRRTPNEFKTAVPPETVLNEFGEKVNPIWDLIHSNRKENQQLSETRDYLLPKLISGEIEVEAAEEIADETAAAQA